MSQHRFIGACSPEVSGKGVGETERKETKQGKVQWRQLKPNPKSETWSVKLGSEFLSMEEEIWAFIIPYLSISD